MKNKKIIYGLLIICVAIGSYFIISVYRSEKLDNQNRTNLFSWEKSAMDKENMGELFTVINELGISELYQEIHDDTHDDTVKNLLEKASKEQIDVYYLVGKAEWGLDKDATAMKNHIDIVSAYNDKNKVKFAGIVFDVEPYLTDEWDIDKMDTMKRYEDAMISMYTYAKKQDIKIIICIPNWLDRVDSAILKNIISFGCDEVAIMNYNKKDEIVAIENEAEFARQVNKSIHCIYEFQRPGKHSLTENETYYHDGIDSANENFRKLKESYSKVKIYFSYHYLSPLIELLKVK